MAERQKEKVPISPGSQKIITKTRTEALSLHGQPRYRVETLVSDQLEDSHLQEISEQFRYIFNNDWPEFAVCPPCDQSLPDGMRKSAKEIYGTPNHVSLTEMDLNPRLPECPNCKAQMQIFHDPEKVREKIGKRLEHDAYTTLVRRAESEELEGFAFSYKASIRKAFESEWHNPFSYMKNPPPEYERNFEELLAGIKCALPEEDVKADTEFLVCNCVAMSQNLRRGQPFLNMMRAFFGNLPADLKGLKIIGETLVGSNSYYLFRACGGTPVEGFLGENQVIQIWEAEQAASTFNMDMRSFIRKVIQERRLYRKEGAEL